MRQPQAIALAAALAALCAAGAQAQTQGQPFNDSTVDKSVAVKQAKEIRKGDPARWHSEDTSRQARLRILQKEIGAAYEEAKNACRETAASGRSACSRRPGRSLRGAAPSRFGWQIAARKALTRSGSGEMRYTALPR